jgi:hypothetical protein
MGWRNIKVDSLADVTHQARPGFEPSATGQVNVTVTV